MNRKNNTCKTVQRWIIDENYSIEDRDGRLGIMCSDPYLKPYFKRFLNWCSFRECSRISAAMIRGDINLRNYRDSLIKDVDHINEGCLENVLESAFDEDYMCEYLYTYENISRKISKKILDYVIEKESIRTQDFPRKHIPDVKRYAVKALSDLKSNDDMMEIFKGIRGMLLERYMEEHGRKRLQEALKNIVENEPISHTQMADTGAERR